MNFEAFFQTVTNLQPHPYQRGLGTDAWPDIVQVPTGLGKTAATVVAWLWKWMNADPETPRRLVYCLPMRVLVEQTERSAREWVAAAAPLLEGAGRPIPEVHVLMGGEGDATWAEHPERPAILVGTQDMLLSRALMRGYGMSRYGWPVHFALLHNDALWIFDELQLMGPGLATSTQLEAFRRTLPLARPSRSLWMSATLNREWLDTVDFRPHLADAVVLGLSDDDLQNEDVRRRIGAAKRLARATTTLTAAGAKAGNALYARDLAAEVAEAHRPGERTLVVLNTVGRAQAVFTALRRAIPGDGPELLLVHSRFRRPDRQAAQARLTATPGNAGQIVVATQAVEAGVDVSSAVAFTELAPWSSLVQRFGRCNRYGERDEATIHWIDVEDTGDLAPPYEAEALAAARERLTTLSSASPGDLPPTDEAAPLVPVLRRKDLMELFNTDPDLSGFDVDVSPYIRDADDRDVQVFWRDLSSGEKGQPAPSTDEICRASLAQIRTLLQRIDKSPELTAWVWDGLADRWERLRQERIRPGLAIMVDRRAGGYEPTLGFAPESKSLVSVDLAPEAGARPDAYGADPGSRHGSFVPLAEHLAAVEREAAALCAALGDPAAPVVTRAARWHDVGKAHPVFQQTVTRDFPEAVGDGTLWAKSPSRRHRHTRKHFRHEVASLLAWLSGDGADPDGDLVAYLIAAHHGKVRMSLRAMPDEHVPPTDDRRFARGIWEGDRLPAVDLPDGSRTPETEMKLDIVELGTGEQGPSWSARTQALLTGRGPFVLAWLEMLVRVADWRGSAEGGAA
jgi:CRISPR-associated endonuclease/helicase Cas3